LADGANVLLVPPERPAALAQAIAMLAADARQRQRLASGAQALAQQFGWEAIAAQHEALYARLAAR
ncbi:MAG TPA: glycosyl transferase family 1, partial [Kouleothrix sp.]|nr:glycosyl transferase family 1 [Kouleothrix sp.]